jgi:hypothetical protein
LELHPNSNNVLDMFFFGINFIAEMTEPAERLKALQIVVTFLRRGHQDYLGLEGKQT